MAFSDLDKLIKVKDGSPLWRILLVALQRGAAPYTVNVICILPKIENLAAEYFRRRYSVFCLGDGQGLLVESAITRILLQDRQRLAVLGLDPLQGAGAGHVFQPDIRIIRDRGGAIRSGARGHPQNHRTEKEDLGWQACCLHALEYSQAERRDQE